MRVYRSVIIYKDKKGLECFQFSIQRYLVTFRSGPIQQTNKSPLFGQLEQQAPHKISYRTHKPAVQHTTHQLVAYYTPYPAPKNKDIMIGNIPHVQLNDEEIDMRRHHTTQRLRQLHIQFLQTNPGHEGTIFYISCPHVTGCSCVEKKKYQNWK